MYNLNKRLAVHQKKKKKKYCDANLCQQFAEMYFRTQSKPLRWRFKRKQSIVINH